MGKERRSEFREQLTTARVTWTNVNRCLIPYRPKERREDPAAADAGAGAARPARVFRRSILAWMSSSPSARPSAVSAVPIPSACRDARLAFRYETSWNSYCKGNI